MGFASTNSTGISSIPSTPPKPGDDNFGVIPGPQPISPGRGMNDTDPETEAFGPDPNRLDDGAPAPDPSTIQDAVD